MWQGSSAIRCIAATVERIRHDMPAFSFSLAAFFKAFLDGAAAPSAFSFVRSGSACSEAVFEAMGKHYSRDETRTEIPALVELLLESEICGFELRFRINSPWKSSLLWAWNSARVNGVKYPFAKDFLQRGKRDQQYGLQGVSEAIHAT